MPSRMGPKNLVARPDRIDFRDREYQPPLRSLPDQYPGKEQVINFISLYTDHDNILDQGEEGACTGFGLAAVINYIYWSRWVLSKPPRFDWKKRGAAARKPPQVSPHMLYRNARLHDEWEGSDYEGSSCRGAMKGWHKHGVCSLGHWGAAGVVKTLSPFEWQLDAASRPLGAYYRVSSHSILDMQAAINEVGAIYCSADVHEGWDDLDSHVVFGKFKLPVIRPHAEVSGGHAFALVGYTADGFIVQNSWGGDWGSAGFALLTYEDWAKNGVDAWVASLGAPMVGGTVAAAKERKSGKATGAAVRADMSATILSRRMAAFLPAQTGGAPQVWSEDQAYRHSIVLGNDGKLLQRLSFAEDTVKGHLDVVVADGYGPSKHQHICIYVHGGLNDEDAAVNRSRRLGPWFEANGIYPVFIVWRTGFTEALGQIGLDAVKRLEEQIKAVQARGRGPLIDAMVSKMREAFDRAFEAMCEKVFVKAVWTQMKQNATMAGADGGVLEALAASLHDTGSRSIHLLGHSAGSIMIGHLLTAARRSAVPLSFQSCGLYAPACTLSFAAEHFGAAMSEGGALANGALAIDLLSEAAETRDSVGPYGKSLLYLVSRALEDEHKTPILGLELSHRGAAPDDGMTFDWSRPGYEKARTNWKDRVISTGRAKLSFLPEKAGEYLVKSGPATSIPLAHGCFDNHLAVMNASIKRMLNQNTIPVEITDLTGF